MTRLDLLVLALYGVGIVTLGSVFYRRSRTPRGFTAASGALPGWAVGLSLFGTYLSSNTFLGVPGKAYASNWNSFVFSLSLPFAAWIAAKYFVPFYRGTGEISAYTHLERRFGRWARIYAIVCYLLTQLARDGSHSIRCGNRSHCPYRLADRNYHHRYRRAGDPLHASRWHRSRYLDRRRSELDSLPRCAARRRDGAVRHARRPGADLRDRFAGRQVQSRKPCSRLHDFNVLGRPPLRSFYQPQQLRLSIRVSCSVTTPRAAIARRRDPSGWPPSCMSRSP